MSINTAHSGTNKAYPLPWRDPFMVLHHLQKQHPFISCLHSSLDVGFSGGKSFMAFHDKAHVKGRSFDLLAETLTASQSSYDNAWFGYLGYELKHALESLPQADPFAFDLPPLWMVHYRVILVFEHQAKTLTAYTDNPDLLSGLETIDAPEEASSPAIASLSSNMTKAEYFQKVETIREAILRGDLYQANLTRKFSGEFSEKPCSVTLFSRLCDASPAPYSAYLKFNDTVILSSSPEQFMHIDSQGIMETRPIKGSAPRYADPKQDEASRQALSQSTKDKAENLMIVDLMRNDFSRSAQNGSVDVPTLFEVTSYATVHHMASTIRAKKRPEVPSLNAVKASFPPGSMTGAPKIKAMELCGELEGVERGVYSGAIGWFGGDGSCDLSVVIRTLILEGKRWEFQVGGAIVADSTPESEWEETLTKARGLCAMLGIKEERLISL